MAREKWVVVGKRWCEYRDAEAELLERRVFPSGVLRFYQPPRVVEQRCNCAIECNMAGYPCKWAFTNPDNDPFNRT
jgi:hypothetical protein